MPPFPLWEMLMPPPPSLRSCHNLAPQARYTARSSLLVCHCRFRNHGICAAPGGRQMKSGRSPPRGWWCWRQSAAGSRRPRSTPSRPANRARQTAAAGMCYGDEWEANRERRELNGIMRYWAGIASARISCSARLRPASDAPMRPPTHPPTPQALTGKCLKDMDW